MDTKTINIRNVPEEVWRAAKIECAKQGITLTEFVIRALRAAVGKGLRSKAIG